MERLSDLKSEEGRMSELVVTYRCSVMPTTRNIHSFPLLQKIQLVMCCIRLVDSVTFSGSPVYDDDIIEDVCENMGTIMFQLGTVLCNGLCQGEPPQRPKKEEEDHTGMVRCTNYGCYQWYRPEENNPTACHYHTAPPVFHDNSKGWSCCQKYNCTFVLIIDVYMIGMSSIRFLDVLWVLTVANKRHSLLLPPQL